MGSRSSRAPGIRSTVKGWEEYGIRSTVKGWEEYVGSGQEGGLDGDGEISGILSTKCVQDISLASDKPVL